jgi:hypothetical protein
MLALVATNAHVAPSAKVSESLAAPAKRRSWFRRPESVDEFNAEHAANLHANVLDALHKGAAFLMRIQQANGDWPQQHISGVFNQNCMITYANYRNIFPIWALGMYRRCVLLGEEI